MLWANMNVKRFQAHSSVDQLTKLGLDNAEVNLANEQLKQAVKEQDDLAVGLTIIISVFVIYNRELFKTMWFLQIQRINVKIIRGFRF